jgi:hypothetical protein
MVAVNVPLSTAGTNQDAAMEWSDERGEGRESWQQSGFPSLPAGYFSISSTG